MLRMRASILLPNHVQPGMPFAETFTLESGKLYKSFSLGQCADGDTLSIYGVEVIRIDNITVNATGYNDIEGAICKQSHPNLTVGAASFTSVCKGYFSVPGSFGSNIRVDKVVQCPEDSKRH